MVQHLAKTNFIERCEQERLHLSGKVQSGNSLAVFDNDGVITDISTNFDPALLLHKDVFDAIANEARISTFTSLPNLHFVSSSEENNVNRRYFSLFQRGVFIEGALLKYSSTFVLEIYGEGDDIPSPSPKLPPDFDDYTEFVEQIRLLTHLDRIMVYRFTGNEDGEVVAESHIPDIGSYLNHRYPASDVPMIARRLYLLNPWRTIRDRDGEAASVISIDQKPPDLTYSDVRSVSPYHIEYMQAMGTCTSLSIPIAVDGRLWGLVSGHSKSYTHLTLSQLLKAKELSRRFNNKVLTDLHKRQFEALDSLGRLERRIRRDVLDERSLETILSESATEICGLVESSALIATDGEVVFSHNFVDPIENVASLISVDNCLERPYVSEAIPKDFPLMLSNYVGLARVVFVFEGAVWNLILFRREEIEEITWGHRSENPSNTSTSPYPTSPSASFESYVELRHGHCRSFTRYDIRTLTTIARALSYGERSGSYAPL